MNCPKCNRPAMSKTSPRCGFCGAAMREGELDWKDAQVKAVTAQIESNMTTEALNKPFTRQQREYALRNLSSGRDSDLDVLLTSFADGLAHDYSEEQLASQRQCHCKVTADRVARVEWSFDHLLNPKADSPHPVLLLLKVIPFVRLGLRLAKEIDERKHKMVSEFVTYHPVCSACEPRSFDSKSTIEKVVEPLPKQFRKGKVQFHPHPQMG